MGNRLEGLEAGGLRLGEPVLLRNGVRQKMGEKNEEEELRRTNGKFDEMQAWEGMSLDIRCGR